MSLIDELKKTLNPEQFEAAVFMNGPVAIMAGAGSGKTHTLMSRVAYLVEQGVSAEQILMLTFTNAAADEMKNRASTLLDKRCENIVACTYHKFCNMMIRRYGNRMNIKDYAILSYPETKNMVNYVKSSDPMFDNLKGFPSAGVIVEIMSIMINKRAILHDILSMDKFLKYEMWEQEIQILIDNVTVYGWRNQKFTYDDLLVHMNTLLDDVVVCKQIATKYKYIMIDEYQDTNCLQESIILKLSRFNNNIMVVGDISQSIYGFRGANVRNLQNFHKKLANCKEITLHSNYRSTQEILDAANDIMRANVRSWKYFDMHAVNKRGPMPVLLTTRDTNTEVSAVMSIVESFHSNGISYDNIAILERGSMSSFGIENELTQNNISFTKMGGMKFMDYDCVGDMIAYFSIVVNPHDLLSWFRLLQLHPYIGKNYAKKIADESYRFDFLTNNEYQRRKFYKELISISQQYAIWKQYTDLLSLFDIISKFYFDTRLRAIDNSRMNEDAKKEAILKVEVDKTVVKQLRNMAKKYDSIISFVDDIMLDSVSKEDDKVGNLTISTIHSAKGLEWDVVIILDCVEGVFPAKIAPSMYGSEEDEEELRCFYVAMTRAKRFLLVVVPDERVTYGGVDVSVMSHYLNRSVNKFKAKRI